MRVLPYLCVVATVLTGCHSGSGDSAPLLAAATIGPQGGELVIQGGSQDGWRLSVPAGALTQATELRVRDVRGRPITGLHGVSTAPEPGEPFVIEPIGLELLERATLRAPYIAERIGNTAPGNVICQEIRNGNLISHEPTAVDVVEERIDVPIRYLGYYQVIKGPVAQAVAYYPAVGTNVELADGYRFEVEETPAGSPFFLGGGQRWRITSPVGDELLYFVDNQLFGRESISADWREVWPDPYPVWTIGELGLPIAGTTMNSQVHSPITMPSLGGQITVYGVRTWTAPRTFGAVELRDVVQLRINLAWNRHDLGVGQREYFFYFAPGIGLLSLTEDGVEHARLTPGN